MVQTGGKLLKHHNELRLMCTNQSTEFCFGLGRIAANYMTHDSSLRVMKSVVVLRLIVLLNITQTGKINCSCFGKKTKTGQISFANGFHI